MDQLEQAWRVYEDCIATFPYNDAQRQFDLAGISHSLSHQIGADCHGQCAFLRDQLRKIGIPSDVFLNPDSSGHAVVISAIDDGQKYLFDPAWMQAQPICLTPVLTGSHDVYTSSRLDEQYRIVTSLQEMQDYFRLQVSLLMPQHHLLQATVKIDAPAERLEASSYSIDHAREEQPYLMLQFWDRTMRLIWTIKISTKNALLKAGYILPSMESIVEEHSSVFSDYITYIARRLDVSNDDLLDYMKQAREIYARMRNHISTSHKIIPKLPCTMPLKVI